MAFQCHVVDCYRAVESLLPNTLKLSGAYMTRQGVEAPHSFTFVPRGWLSEPLKAAVEQGDPVRASSDRRDVIALVRQFMADDTLSQRPLLTYPAKLISESITFLEKLSGGEEVRRGSLEPARAAELKSLAAFLGSKYGDMYAKSARYLSDLAASSDGRDAAAMITPLERLSFLDTRRGFAGLRPDTPNTPVPAAVVPWTLKVTYSRATSSALRAVRD